MTTPDERSRALVWAGGFLIEIARDKGGLLLDIRQRAVAIARHFPTIEQVSHMALFRHLSGLDMGLEDPREYPAWAKDCKFGPLRYSNRLAWPEDGTPDGRRK
jgi:hypothetical protein